MFASIRSNFIRIYLNVDGAKEPAKIPSKLGELKDSYKTWPRKDTLVTFGAALMKTRWILPKFTAGYCSRKFENYPFVAKGTLKSQCEGEEIYPDSITIELYSRKFTGNAVVVDKDSGITLESKFLKERKELENRVTYK